MRHRMLAISVLAVCALHSALFAQAGRETITGLVTDPSGAVVANAPVEAKHVETGQVFNATTTDTGNYTLTQLPIGGYEITLDVRGFKKFNRTGITLNATQIIRNDVALEVGSNVDIIF